MGSLGFSSRAVVIARFFRWFLFSVLLASLSREPGVMSPTLWMKKPGCIALCTVRKAPCEVKWAWTGVLDPTLSHCRIQVTLLSLPGCNLKNRGNLLISWDWFGNHETLSAKSILDITGSQNMAALFLAV